jgi:ABC-type branched-chain amino acid transport system, permease component
VTTQPNHSAIIDAVSASFADASRWRALEVAFWLLPIAAVFVFPRHYLLLNEIVILGLFALSLDLVLGYAGIVSLGHAAFFGFGAYGAALFAKHIHADPLLGLAVAIAGAGVLGLVTSVLVLRGSDLTRLMVTLGIALILFEIANRLHWLTGGADGLQGVVMKPLLGAFEFDLSGRTACFYSLVVLFAFFLLARRVVHAPFGLSLQALRDNRLRASAVGIPVNFRLTAIYTFAAAMAGAAGALLAQTTGFASLDGFAFHRSAEVLLVLVIGGAGYLYGGLIGAALFALMHDRISALTPQYWQFWIGLILVLIVLIGRARLVRPWTWLAAARGTWRTAGTR